MFENICSLSAFQLHRVPPQELAISPSLPDLDSQRGKKALLKRASLPGDLRLPLDVLASERSHRLSGKSVKTHLWTGELPTGALCENVLDITLTSPLFTLLTMAPLVSETHLTMAMYEMCGTFAVHQPSKDMQAALDRRRQQGTVESFGTWRQVRDAAGRPTSLWTRPPLITLDELERFDRRIQGMRGCKKFHQAAMSVTGVTASPFEVQASMRLHLSRRKGGEGFPPFANNQRVPLSASARRLAGQNTCYLDIFFEQTDEHGPIDIECHGHMTHDGGSKPRLDANRVLALQSMGIEVILLTHEQLVNRQRFDAFADHLAKRLGIKRRPKTGAMQRAEARLLSQLFIDWRTLGS